MKIFKNKSLGKKLIFILLVIIFLSIILPHTSQAEAKEAAQGGKLLQPVVDLLVTLGDGIMDIVQNAIVGTSGHISLDIAAKGFWIKVLGVVAAILVFVVAAVLTGGISAVVGAIGGVVGSVLTAIGSTTIFTMMITVATAAAALGTYTVVVDVLNGACLPDVTILPTYSVSPQEIFEGKLLLFDVNFFQPKQVWINYTDKDGKENAVKIDEYDETSAENVNNKINYYYYVDSNKTEIHTSKQNTALDLSKIISRWYYSIRNIAIIVMMLILIYIGIRMMLSSIASEKSKYKKMLGDWVVSMCLIFVLHYIMVFAVNINESIVKLISSSTEEKQNSFVINLNDEMKNKDEFVDAVIDVGKKGGNEGELGKFLMDKDENALYNEDGSKNSGAGEAATFTWLTNLVGRMRMKCQLQDGSSEYVGYALAYLVLVFYTLFFTFTYLKRVLYMAFLTIIAPLVAMTYSIDKIADGKAQAFNMWLKEYIFNLLIQPMHLMLYLVLISMAYDLAATNIIYTLVAIGFMIPAEKFIRKMFGFEKAQTPGMLGGAAGAALTMSGMQKLAHFAGHGPGAKGGNKPVGKLDKSTSEDPKKIRTADSGRGMNALLGDVNKDGNNNNNNSAVENTEAQSSTTGSSSSNYEYGGSNYGYGGASAADANYSNLNLKDSEDPVAKMEREALEEKMADGQLTPDELTDEQKEILGIREEENPMEKMEREALEEKIADGQLTPDELTDEQRAILEKSRTRNNAARMNRTVGHPTVRVNRATAGMNSAGTTANNNAQQIIRTQNNTEVPKNDDDYERRKEEYNKKEQQAISESRRETFKRTVSKGVRNAVSKENIGGAVSRSIKAGTKFVGTTTGALTGAALGIASGDISKVEQNMALGATAGGSIGTAVGNGVVKGAGGVRDRYKEQKTEYEKEKYGEKYAQYKRDQQDKEFLKDKEARKYFAQQCSTELAELKGKEKKQKLDEIMQDAIEYRREGVTDNSIIVKARKLDKNGNTTSTESKLAAVMATKSKDNIERMKYYQEKVTKQIGGDKAIRINQNAAKLAGF